MHVRCFGTSPKRVGSRTAAAVAAISWLMYFYCLWLLWVKFRHSFSFFFSFFSTDRRTHARKNVVINSYTVYTNFECATSSFAGKQPPTVVNISRLVAVSSFLIFQKNDFYSKSFTCY